MHKAIDWESIPAVPYEDSVLDGKAPLFITAIDRNDGTHYLVKRADETVVRVIAKTPAPSQLLVTDTPRNSREYLRKWLDRIDNSNWPERVLKFKRRMLNDLRMREFWEWFEGLTFTRAQYLSTSLWATEVIWRGTVMPGKPGNMTPTQRSAYFDSVRKHASALADLLFDTKFDREHLIELTEDQLDRTLDKALYDWGDDESDEGHVVAFQVTPDGKYRHHYDFPESHLVQLLGEVLEWTLWDDQWDGRFFGSSSPIVQSNSRSTPIVYFTCSTFDTFANYGVEMPFPVLATVTNVALDLAVEDEVDEEVVRRQVRRHQKRTAALAAARASSFEESGQSSDNLQNSVLFDPF